MRQMTMALFVASVVLIAIAFGVERMAAQDTTPPVLRVGKTTLYTSPMHAFSPGCSVLNASDDDLTVETHLVYNDSSLLDNTSVQSTVTLSPKHTTMIGGGSISLTPNALLYCTFSFAGPARQVRAIMVDSSGASSEAR